MAVRFNADFNRFVTFATEQNASGKAIADAANGKFDVAGLSRQVVVASGDKVGTARISQRTKIDLTKPMPEIVDVTFSQTYSSDKKRHNPNIEAIV